MTQEARDDEREALFVEVNAGDFEDRAWMIDIIDRLVAALAEKHPEPEWEYGIKAEGDDDAWSDLSDDLDYLMDAVGSCGEGDQIVRRAKAGPWVPVGEGEQSVATPAVSERIPGDELTVDSPSYSVRRFLSALDGIASSDGEFSISVEHVDAGGTFTIHDSNGFPLWEMNLQGHPSDNDEAERLAE